MLEIGATAKVASSSVKFVPAIGRWLLNHHQTTRSIAEVKSLLGFNTDDAYSYRVAMHHPLLQRGTPHPDDLAAFAALAGPAFSQALDRGWAECDDWVEADLSQSVAMVGAPDAELLTRLIFGYRAISSGGGLAYIGDTLDLPFRWEVERSRMRARCLRYNPFGQLVERPNWPIVDNRLAQPRRLFPVVDNLGFLQSDYLLITRLPNFLSDTAWESGRSLLSLGGAHRVGTRATKLLLRRTDILGEIHTALAGRVSAFQALIEVRSIVHRPELGSRARDIKVHSVVPFEVDEEKARLAQRAVMRRWTDWAASAFDDLSSHEQVSEVRRSVLY